MISLDGTVPTTQATIFSVPPGSEVELASIHISNTSGAARTCTIYLNVTGTARPISAQNMALAADATAICETPLKLSPGCTLEGVASGAGVGFLITGQALSLQ